MGEVYRARDTKLGRDVAIKILPSLFMSDPERRSRFAREARLLATLNHPHIGAIYGLEESDGVMALVLELVEGPTLADRLARGPLPVAEAIALARQIAEALDAAHEKGIVHRDLKPDNIVLQSSANASGVPSGDVRAKVLDFGLAKTMAVELEGDLTQRPSGSLEGTEEGRILGTPAYMSPEQARGQAVDRRSDIWAFGCVLFEMLAGRRPFEGETMTDTLVQVLEREPDWGALPAPTPEPIRTLLRRCLVKDPSHRSRDIGDVRLELDAIVAAPSNQARAPSSRLRSRYGVLAGVGVLIVVPLIWLATQSYPALVDTPLQITRLTFDDGLQTNPALSFDGKFFAYASNKTGNFDIYTQPVGGGNPVPVTNNPAHDWQPDWSVRSEIVFRSERDGGGLYVVPPTGGHERRVASFGNLPRWSPDGKRILFRRWPSGITYIVDRDGDAPRVCDPCGALASRWRHDSRHVAIAHGWFRDSRQISVLATSPAPKFEPRLGIVDIESGAMDEWTLDAAVVTSFRELRIATLCCEPLAWAPDARAVYFAGQSRGLRAIWKLDVNPETRTADRRTISDYHDGRGQHRDYDCARDRGHCVRRGDAHATTLVIPA